MMMKLERIAGVVVMVVVVKKTMATKSRQTILNNITKYNLGSVLSLYHIVFTANEKEVKRLRKGFKN